MLILSFIFVIVCDLLGGSEAGRIFYRLYIYMYYGWRLCYQEVRIGIPLTGLTSPYL